MDLATIRKRISELKSALYLVTLLRPELPADELKMVATQLDDAGWALWRIEESMRFGAEAAAH